MPVSLNDVHTLVEASAVDQWNFMNQPTFKFESDIYKDGETYRHYGTAVYKDDVSLTIAWGMGWKVTGYATDDWKGIWIDIFWNGALVDRIDAVRFEDQTEALVYLPGGNASRFNSDLEESLLRVLNERDGKSSNRMYEIVDMRSKL